MTRKNLITIALALLIAMPLTAQSKHFQKSAYPSYKGLVMAGYQGWFHNPDKGMMFTDSTRTHIDAWPDVSEYSETYATAFRNADGSVARFFSSDDESTVDTHFRWMKEYGVDGVFMQRFFSSVKGTARGNDVSVTVLKHALKVSKKYSRAIAVMYDLSGLNPGKDDCTAIIKDWKYLVDSVKVTSWSKDNMYLQHNGKPLVVIWGVGFPDRPYDIRDIALEKLIDFLKNDPVYGGCSVMLGVPTFWRDLNSDCIHDPYLHDLIRKADIVLPWMVQRFTPLLHFDMNRYRDVILDDIKWCNENGLDYVPIVYPGFSWYNLSRGASGIGGQKPLGSIPRLGGTFYWSQIYTAIRSGAQMLYVAMFDEVNEGTAIFKCTDNPPVNGTVKFIDMDGKPSDHYLWLTGQGAKMLRNEIPLSSEMPERK
jgi:hypothetical protein